MYCIKLLRNDRGATIIFIAIALVVLIGIGALAIDVGQLYLAKQRAQNVCDAAALAGAFYLEPGRPDLNGTAEDMSSEYFSANNGENAWEVVPGSPDIGLNTIAILTGGIRTQGEVNVEFFFAPIIGFDSGSVSASARARLEGIGLLDYPILPLAISRWQVRDRVWDEVRFLTHYWDDDSRFFFSFVNLFPVSTQDPEDPFDAGLFFDQLAGRAEAVPLAVGDTIMQVQQNPIDDILTAIGDRIIESESNGFFAIIPVVDVTMDALHDKNEPVEVYGFAGIRITRAERRSGHIPEHPDAEAAHIEGQLNHGVIGTDNNIRWLHRFAPQVGQPPNQIYQVRLVE